MNANGKSTLGRHLDDHGTDVGATTEQSYLNSARSFLEKAPTSTTQSFV
jgi:pyocin large subunit-like protein